MSLLFTTMLYEVTNVVEEVKNVEENEKGKSDLKS